MPEELEAGRTRLPAGKARQGEGAGGPQVRVELSRGASGRGWTGAQHSRGVCCQPTKKQRGASWRAERDWKQQQRGHEGRPPREDPRWAEPGRRAAPGGALLSPAGSEARGGSGPGPLGLRAPCPTSLRPAPLRPQQDHGQGHGREVGGHRQGGSLAKQSTMMA